MAAAIATPVFYGFHNDVHMKCSSFQKTLDEIIANNIWRQSTMRVSRF